MRPEGLDLAAVGGLARALAPMRDRLTLAGAQAGVPYPVRYLDLVGMPEPSPEHVRQRWATRPGPTTEAVLGADGAGPGVRRPRAAGTAHDARRRHRCRQEHPAADPGHRAPARQPPRRAEPRARRLQGRQRVPAVRELPARRRPDPLHREHARRRVRRGRRGPRARLGARRGAPPRVDPRALRRRTRRVLAGAAHGPYAAARCPGSS